MFDLETTGAKAPPCRITEIGAYRVKGGKVTEEFHRLVNPEMPIPPFIQGLTGISDAMVRDAPKFREVVEDFLAFYRRFGAGGAQRALRYALFEPRGREDLRGLQGREPLALHRPAFA